MSEIIYNQCFLSCSKVSKYYIENQRNIKILFNINFSMKRNEMTAIVGSSGSGKSTLLYLIGGLIKPSTGNIIFEGKLINNLSDKEVALLRNRKLGFIYQFHHLLRDFNALENTAMPLLIRGMNSFQAKKISKEILLSLNLDKYENYYPSELSGGQRQRVAIARALVNKPSLILADEPTGNLDQNNTNKILKILMKMNKIYGTAFLIVTHDIKLASKLKRKLEITDGMLKEIK